jgi:AbrB family looped-hinge helix DNA binding protein
LTSGFPDVLHLTECNEGIMESTITAKGQATIAKAIRAHLRLKPGYRVKFFVHPDGAIVLRSPKLTASAFRGIVKPGPRAVTIEEMSAAAAAGAAATSRKTTRFNRRKRRS